MKYLTKQNIIIAVLVLTVIILVISKCSTSKQADQNTISEVAQNRIDNLESNITALENQNLGYHSVQDSLVLINKGLNKEIYKERTKYAQIALKYDREKQRVKELTNDSAAGLFLDRADCSEFPVLKYDTDYIIPIEPIRFYNLLAVDFDKLNEDYIVCRNETRIQQVQIKTLESLNDLKGDEIINLNEQIKLKEGISSNKDIQIKAVQKQLKQQKVKTYLVGAAGLLFIGAAVVL